MPRKPIDYSKTIIYHFVCKDEAIVDTYVGHTTEFTKRKNTHKTNCSNEKCNAYNFKVYQTIRANGGFENWTMTPLEEYPCENVIQARIREQYWIDKLYSKLNMVKAFVSETKQEYIKKYRNEHREQKRIYDEHYHEEHKEQRNECSKQYRKENKDIVAEKNNEYYQINKEQILIKKKQRISCTCGSTYNISDKSTHLKTLKHQNHVLCKTPSD
jgi:hypothetical protein